ncbi:transmembrane protein 216-like [Diabrotica undecimpunctata]|uniref:transmembrane protein 216-like n=1 Tax=Diabrotica undecimpunctata TaxID=50387 RepID=UPI003B63D5B2
MLKMNVSLTFEVLLYLNSYYFGLFAICEICMISVKYFSFIGLDHYSTDFGVLIGVCFIEILRVLLASRGNLTERKWPVIVAILLTIPSVLGVVYLMMWQSEILRFEYVICGMQLGFCVAEIVTGIMCLFSCCQTPEYY